MRTDSLEVVDGALGLLKLDGCVKKGNPRKLLLRSANSYTILSIPNEY